MSQTSRRTADLSPDEKRALLERLLRKKARESKSFPLSFAQERLWFLNQLEPGSPFYNVPVAVRLTGRLSIPALKQTLNEIVGRHEILRTYFPTADGQPIQVISPARHLALPLVDLSELSEAKRDSEARRLISEESQYGFDLKQGPLLRMNLLRLGGQDHVLILVMHHIISDGWSMGILVREMAFLYEAFLRDDTSPLPELPIQYADFSAWQRQWLQGEVLQQQLSYWKRKLEGAPPVLELPTDRPRPAVQSYRGNIQLLELGRPLSVSLKQLSKQEGVTLFMLMLAAFRVLLYRYSGQQDIAVGTPIAGRNRAEIEGLIGFFVNTLVMRNDIKAERSFKQVIREEKKVVLEAFAHQDVPFERLVLELQPARSLSYTPLFQVMFALEGEPREIMNLPGLTLNSFEPDLRIAKFDLTLSVIDSQDLAIALEYNTDLFDAETIIRMLGHFRNLLEAVAANPEQRISTLPLLAEAERRKLIFDWNDTATDYTRDRCIHELFEAQVECAPEAIAVVFEQQCLTYAELNRRANQLAHYLQEMGVGPESLVGICLERSIEMIVAVVGTLKAGGGYVPLDPDYPRDRLAFIIEDARVSVLITKRGVVPELGQSVAKAVWLDNELEEMAKHKAENPASRVRAQNLAYVIYTSGSTGQPKGVMIAHQGICNRLQWGQQVHPLVESDCILQSTSFSFDVSVLEIIEPLVAGARLIITRPGGARDPAYLVKVIAEQKITVANFVPSMLQALLDESGIEECKYLKQVVAGGEPMQSEIKDRFFARMNAELYNLYGPTEASVDTTSWRCSPGGKKGIVPIGRPLANVRTYVLHSDLQPAPIGVPGELHVAGIGLARGYLNRPDQTAEKFIPNPFSDEPGARMYKTGDVARYFEDGNIEFISRVDDQVKIRGLRIELGEIEATLAQNPHVKETIVLAVDQKRLRASRHLSPEADEDNQSLISQASSDDPQGVERLLAEIEKLSDSEVEMAVERLSQTRQQAFQNFNAFESNS
ncbi:MAG TPA: amino acid adenylation domain-containing protein [Blastocatellia bacterium]|nr:amino acid adenylation domain-containing protein [Blastocatellia bacterium]